MSNTPLTAEQENLIYEIFPPREKSGLKYEAADNLDAQRSGAMQLFQIILSNPSKYFPSPLSERELFERYDNDYVLFPLPIEMDAVEERKGMQARAQRIKKFIAAPAPALTPEQIREMAEKYADCKFYRGSDLWSGCLQGYIAALTAHPPVNKK